MSCLFIFIIEILNIFLNIFFILGVIIACYLLGKNGIEALSTYDITTPTIGGIIGTIFYTFGFDIFFPFRIFPFRKTINIVLLLLPFNNMITRIINTILVFITYWLAIFGIENVFI